MDWRAINVRQTIRASLGLLIPRDRRILILVTLAQMSTAILDLMGVLLIGVVTALAVSAMTDGAPPTFVESGLQHVGITNLDPLQMASVLAIAAGAVLISKSVLNVWLSRRILRFLANRQAMVSGRLAAGLLSRPLLEVQRRSSQETAYALNSGVSSATIVILGQGVVAFSELTLLVVLAIGLLVISPLVTLFTIVFFLVIALILHKVLSGWAGRLGLKFSRVDVASTSAIQEALRTYREVVVSHRRGLYVQRFQDLRWESANVQSDLAFLSLIPKYVFEIALIVGAGLLAASQLLSRDLESAVAIIAVFLAAGSRIVPSMLRLQSATIIVRSAAGQAAPTFALAEELTSVLTAGVPAETFGAIDRETILKQSGLSHQDFDPSVSVSEAWVTYPGASSPALAGVSVKLPAGASLALVGSTGAGKSTLADLILGVLEPDCGLVSIGGEHPSRAIAKWPGAIAYVPQEVSMADGSVRQNVALGLPIWASDDQLVWDALERAHLDTFLRSSRQGLDTVIGEYGMKLSGGQRQRLGVARALYTRPKLLVLDEATSALDAETERAIGDTLRELGGDVTTITIAHRLATIRHCDLVVYLEDGRVVAQGSFDEVRVLAKSFDLQASLLGL